MEARLGEVPRGGGLRLRVMSIPANSRATEPAGRRSAQLQAAAEVLLIFLLFFIHGAWSAPRSTSLTIWARPNTTGTRTGEPTISSDR